MIDRHNRDCAQCTRSSPATFERCGHCGASWPDPTLHRVTLTLCSLCLDGAGGECHTPGCALWINRAPDLSLRDHPCVEAIDGVPFDYETLKRAVVKAATERRAPVQATWGRPHGSPGSVRGSIAWWEHEAAYVGYSSRYGKSQSAERLAERAGFGWSELVEFLGHALDDLEGRAMMGSQCADCGATFPEDGGPHNCNNAGRVCGLCGASLESSGARLNHICGADLRKPGAITVEVGLLGEPVAHQTHVAANDPATGERIYVRRSTRLELTQQEKRLLEDERLGSAEGRTHYETGFLAIIERLLAAAEPEVVICAAIRLPNGRVFRGHRHGDCLRTAHEFVKWNGGTEPGEHHWEAMREAGTDQGFITSRNRYVDRKEGLRLQRAAGIESVAEGGYRGQLFSEDLY